MRPPRVYKTEAIVLKHTKLGEADHILTLYTPYLGKIRAVAKGARRPGSRLGGHVELLTHTSLLVAKGQNLDIITQAQTIESFLPLREDLWRIGCGLYAAELVEQFTPDHQENQPLFHLLHSVLDLIGAAPTAAGGGLVLRAFELHLFGHLGYRPQLRECLGCRRPLELGQHSFSASAGGTLCPPCAEAEPMVRPLSPAALKVLRFLQDNPLSAALRLRAPAALMADLEATLREYITYLLEREPRSAAFLDTLRRQALTGAGP